MTNHQSDSANKDYLRGQRLWYVPNRRGDKPHEVEIEKVGRKWLTLSNGLRAWVEDLTIDGGQYSAPGSCWNSKEEYESMQARCEAWAQLCKLVSSLPSIPTHVSTMEINRIIATITPEKKW